MVLDEAHEKFCEKLADYITMSRLIGDLQIFYTSPFDRYETDVTFKMAFGPSGSVQEGKRVLMEKQIIWVYIGSIRFTKWTFCSF